MKNIGEHSAYSINLMAKSYFKLVDEGRVEEADKMRDAYLSSMAIGGAQKVIYDFFEEYKNTLRKDILTITFSTYFH